MSGQRNRNSNGFEMWKRKYEPQLEISRTVTLQPGAVQGKK